MLVGAETGEAEYGLSQNDYAILRDMLATIGITWRLEDLLTTPDKRQLDIVNIQPEHGGRNFLEEEYGLAQKTNVLALCNIPAETAEKNNIIDAISRCEYAIGSAQTLANVKSAFACSAQHEDVRQWQSQINATGADIVFLYGADSFKARDIIGDGYVEVPYSLRRSAAEGVFISKDYLEKAHDFIMLSTMNQDSLSPFAQWVDDVVMEAEPQEPSVPVRSKQPSLVNV